MGLTTGTMKPVLLIAAIVLVACTHAAPLSADQLNTAATDLFNTLYKARVGDSPAPDPLCLGQCAPKIASCMLDHDCRNGMFCITKCGGTNQTCIFQCDSDFENEVYDNMIKCFFTDHDCMKMPKGQTFDTYGMCKSVEKANPLTTYLGKPLTVEKTKTLLTRDNKDQGNWLVARGLSKAYDCFDCQELYFNTGSASQPVATNASDLAYSAIYKIHKSDGTIRWQQAEYLAEFETFPQPGRMHLHAPDYGGLVHDEDWRVLAVDERTENDPQWVALYYCGGAPGVKEAYEGRCLLTRQRLLRLMPYTPRLGSPWLVFQTTQLLLAKDILTHQQLLPKPSLHQQQSHVAKTSAPKLGRRSTGVLLRESLAESTVASVAWSLPSTTCTISSRRI